MGNISSASTSEEIAEAICALGSAYQQYREWIIANGVSGDLIVTLHDVTELLDHLGVAPLHRMVIQHHFDQFYHAYHKTDSSRRTLTAPLVTSRQTHERNTEARALLKEFNLFPVAYTGDAELLRELHRKGCIGLIPDINNIYLSNKPNNENDQLSALMMSLRRGNYEVAQLLLQHPCINVNCFDKEGHSALLWACFRGYGDIVQAIVLHPGFRKRAGEGRSLLHEAAVHPDIRDFLLASGFSAEE